jgi:methionyl-tRNA formyltransferase
VVSVQPEARPTLRVAFFGTPRFAVPSLEHLLRSHHTVAGVFTQPDRPRGRGQRQSDAPVKQVARENHIPILQPDRLQDTVVLETLRDWHVDLGVVAAYGRILPSTLLELPRFGMINVHASLLPKYRGAAPIQRAVMAGETETGITIIRLVQALDAGPMLGSATKTIETDETAEQVEHDLSFLGAALLMRVIHDITAGTAQEVIQDPAQATYAPRLTKSEGLIDWTKSAQQIHNQIRGLYPWPHAFTYLGGVRHILLESRVESTAPARSDSPLGSAGQILRASGDDLTVKTGDTALAILTIQPEGRRPLRTREFLAGHPVRPGQVFGGP